MFLLHDNLVGDVLGILLASCFEMMWMDGVTYALQFLKRQAHTVLYPHLVTHGTLLAQDGDALDLDAVLDNAGRVAARGDRGTLNTGPGTNAAAPADDRVHHACIVLDFGVFQHDRVLDTSACAHDHTGSNGNVGAQLRCRVHCCGGVDVDWGHDGSGRRGQFVRSGLEGLLEVKGVGGHGGTGRLNLAPEIFRLVDEETVAVGQIGEDILFQTKDFTLLCLVLRCDERGLQVLGRRV